jgi:uncharacterized protein (DUF2384 family)
MTDAGFSADRVKLFCELGKARPQQRHQIIPPQDFNFRLTRGQQLTAHESDRLFRHAYFVLMAKDIWELRESPILAIKA